MNVTRLKWAEWRRGIEELHRGRRQNTGVDGRQRRSTRAHVNHIGLCLRAFVRLEWQRFTTGIRWFAAKQRIIRDAVRRYIERPLDNLPDMATA